MKCGEIAKSKIDKSVTPLVGVWIEIKGVIEIWRLLESLPSWECGLKYTLHVRAPRTYMVTPLVGVWIEINGLVSAP